MIVRSGAAPDPLPTSELLPRQLWPADISHLRLADHPRLDEADAAALVIQSPGSSFWIPETGEFLLVTPWRHRAEILTIHTSGAFSHEPGLMQAAIEHGRQAGYAALVVVNLGETRHPAFYSRHRLTMLEEIVTYEHRHPERVAPLPAGIDVSFRHVEPDDHNAIAALLELDHDAFPWLWRNSPAEFESYLRFPGVEVWLAHEGSEAVSYIGLTRYRGWGHLDRIATQTRYQGRGYGRVALQKAVHRLVELGARRVALSTQGDNDRSRRLYARTGFRRTTGDDYAIYGAIFDTDVESTP